MLRGEEMLSVRNATRAATAWVASPVGRLARIEVLVTISCCLLAVLVLLGSGRRASRRATFRLAVWSVLMLSYPAVSYTIGLMQSASFRNELIVAWGCFLLLLLGCADGIAAYSLNDSDQQARTILNQGLQVVYVLILLLSYVGALPLHLKVLLFLLWALSAAKLVMRVRSSVLAGRDSVLTVENKLIADYMSNKEHMEGGRNYDATTMKGYKYVVAGEADRPIDPSDDDIVTVEKVWQCQGILLSSDVDAAARRRKDICLSFAMFKLLRRRLGGFPLTEARLNKTRDFVKVGLLAGKEHERMYRVIEVELGFLFDFYYARYRSPKETLIPDALLFAAVVATSLGTLFSPAVLDYRPSSSAAVATGYDIWLTRTVIALFLVLESFQFLMLVFSDWHKVKMLCRYVRDKSWHNRPGLQRMLKLMCQVSLIGYWNNSVGQYSLLLACLHSQRKGVWQLPLPGTIMGFLIRSRMTRHRKLPEEVKRSIYVFLKNGLTRVRYGEHTLEKNGVRGILRLSARPIQLPATSAAERILVWHIATQVCDLMSQSELGKEASGSNKWDTSGHSWNVDSSLIYRHTVHTSSQQPRTGWHAQAHAGNENRWILGMAPMISMPTSIIFEAAGRQQALGRRKKIQMASSYLVVHVGDANVPSSSSTASGTSYYVELRFNGQSARTEMKENARWNHIIRFPRREQQQGDIDDGDEGHHASGSGGLDLEAAVYSIDEASNSESLLGKAVVDEKDFDSHSSKAVFFPHDLVKSSSSDHMAGHTGLGRLVNGKLTLKVFHAPADDKALLFEIEDDNRDRQAEDGGVDKVKKKAFRFLFSIKDHLYGDAYNRTSSAVGNTALLQPAGDDGDLVRDELVGKLYFYLKDIPVRHPDDAQPEPTWHPLLDEGGKATLDKASLLLAIWIGSQADEAYRHAWESPYGPKVYENPRLWCLRVTIVEVQGVVACDEDDAGSDTARSLRDKLFCRARLGEQVRKTKLASKTMQTTSSGSYEWMEDLAFIAAQPFFESNLQVDVVAAASNNNSGTEELQEGEVIGKLSIPLAWIEKRDAAAYDFDRLATPTPQWFDLKNPSPARPHTDWGGSSVDEGVVGGSGSVSHMRIRLRSLLDGGYHIGHDPQGHMDDTRPAERQLWRPPITRVHLGILRATGLQTAVAYFVPYKKLLVAIAGFYIMRHPRLRPTKTTPSIIANFFLRSPSKRDELM
ncbi:uncharacterized protein C2845_PM08G07990 [Panicum miliaceum]|uniref:DUF4220 domain-containing protein n=1 Tax=Panicum miliaceum TaxID=4540 RepID=A0A3L6R1A7_PANMI|nr:uncharacterized protein C2845_PM08G07990 [Panicum miliaceum]